MKRRNTFLVGVILLLGLVLSLACATMPTPPARETPDLSVIGIAASISAPLWGHTQAEYVYFVRLDDSETYAHDIRTVGQAEVAFIGEIVLDKRNWEDADDVQLHYYRLLAPGHEDSNFLVKALSGQRHDAGIGSPRGLPGRDRSVFHV